VDPPLVPGLDDGPSSHSNVTKRSRITVDDDIAEQTFVQGIAPVAFVSSELFKIEITNLPTPLKYPVITKDPLRYYFPPYKIYI